MGQDEAIGLCKHSRQSTATDNRNGLSVQRLVSQVMQQFG